MAKKKIVQQVINAMSDAADDLHKLGPVGDDALRNIPKNLNTEEATQAMINASRDIRGRGLENARVPNYNRAKGTKEIINPAPNTRTSSSNLPATPEQLRQANKSFNDAVYSTAYNSRPNRVPDYSRAKGTTEYTDTWESARRSSWNKNSTKTEGGRGEIIPEVKIDPAKEHARYVDTSADLHLKRKILENANRTPWERFKDKLSDRVTKSSLNRSTTRNRRAYNEYIYSKGSNDFVRTNKEFARMQNQMGIHGRFDGTAEGFDALNRAHGRRVDAANMAAARAKAAEEAAKAAEDIGQNTGFLEYVGNAARWATQDMNHAIAVAGAGLGIGLIGSEILDED